MLFYLVCRYSEVGAASELPVEDLIFSAGGGFLFGAVAGYAIKKVMRIAAVVIGFFIAGLAYLSYKGWIDVKWVAMENATRSSATTPDMDMGTQMHKMVTILQMLS